MNTVIQNISCSREHIHDFSVKCQTHVVTAHNTIANRIRGIHPFAPQNAGTLLTGLRLANSRNFCCQFLVFTLI